MSRLAKLIHINMELRSLQRKHVRSFAKQVLDKISIPELQHFLTDRLVEHASILSDQFFNDLWHFINNCSNKNQKRKRSRRSRIPSTPLSCTSPTSSSASTTSIISPRTLSPTNSSVSSMSSISISLDSPSNTIPTPKTPNANTTIDITDTTPYTLTRSNLINHPNQTILWCLPYFSKLNKSGLCECLYMLLNQLSVCQIQSIMSQLLVPMRDSLSNNLINSMVNFVDSSGHDERRNGHKSDGKCTDGCSLCMDNKDNINNNNVCSAVSGGQSGRQSGKIVSDIVVTSSNDIVDDINNDIDNIEMKIVDDTNEMKEIINDIQGIELNENGICWIDDDSVPVDIFVHINNFLKLSEVLNFSISSRSVFLKIENQSFWNYYCHNKILSLTCEKIKTIESNSSELYCFHVNKADMQMNIRGYYYCSRQCSDYTQSLNELKSLEPSKSKHSKHVKTSNTNKINTNHRCKQCDHKISSNKPKPNTSPTPDTDNTTNITLKCTCKRKLHATKRKIRKEAKQNYPYQCPVSKLFEKATNPLYCDHFQALKKLVNNLNYLEVSNGWRCIFDHIPMDWLFKMKDNRNELNYRLYYVRSIDKSDLSTAHFEKFCQNYNSQLFITLPGIGNSNNNNNNDNNDDINGFEEYDEVSRPPEQVSKVQIRPMSQIWYQYAVTKPFKHLNKLNCNFNALYFKIGDSSESTQFECKSMKDFSRIFHRRLTGIDISFGNRSVSPNSLVNTFFDRNTKFIYSSQRDNNRSIYSKHLKLFDTDINGNSSNELHLSDTDSSSAEASDSSEMRMDVESSISPKSISPDNNNSNTSSKFIDFSANVIDLDKIQEWMLPNVVELRVRVPQIQQHSKDITLFESLKTLLEHRALMRLLNFNNSVSVVILEPRMEGFRSLQSLDPDVLLPNIRVHFGCLKETLEIMLRNFNKLSKMIIKLRLYFCRTTDQAFLILKELYKYVVDYVLNFQDNAKLTSLKLNVILRGKTEQERMKPLSEAKHFGEINEIISDGVDMYGDRTSLKKRFIVDGPFERMRERIGEGVKYQPMAFGEYDIMFDHCFNFDSRL